MEVLGIGPRTSHVLSTPSTPELYPPIHHKCPFKSLLMGLILISETLCELWFHAVIWNEGKMLQLLIHYIYYSL